MLNALAVNIIIIWIILEAGKEQRFLNVIALAVNVIIIFESEETTVLNVIALAVNVI